MAKFKVIAKHGLAYCEYNQALISIQNLDNVQKIRLIYALLEDIQNNLNTSKGDF